MRSFVVFVLLGLFVGFGIAQATFGSDGQLEQTQHHEKESNN